MATRIIPNSAAGRFTMGAHLSFGFRNCYCAVAIGSHPTWTDTLKVVRCERPVQQVDSLAPGWRETGGLATQRVLGDDERGDPRTSLVPSDPSTRFRLRPSLSLDCALLLIAAASVPSGIASITVSTIVMTCILRSWSHAAQPGTVHPAGSLAFNPRQHVVDSPLMPRGPRCGRSRPSSRRRTLPDPRLPARIPPCELCLFLAPALSRLSCRTAVGCSGAITRMKHDIAAHRAQRNGQQPIRDVCRCSTP